MDRTLAYQKYNGIDAVYRCQILSCKRCQVIETEQVVPLSSFFLYICHPIQQFMADYIDQAIKAVKLDSLDNNQSLAFVKQKTGLHPSQIALALIVFLSVVLVIAQASAFITAIACFLIPAYFSFLALESHDKSDDTKYLTYWVVFAICEVIAPLFLWIMGGFFYTIFRVALTVACLHPQINLSQQIYNQAVSPFLTKHERVIDDFGNRGRDKFDEIAERSKREYNELLKKTE